MAGKKYRAAAEQVDRDRAYSVEEAVELAKKVAYAKFDETVELGYDARRRSAQSRPDGARHGRLPHGLGKSKRVVVIASPEKMQEAQEAGADEVGGDDIVDRIKGGWLDFDALIATPDMMRSVGQLGKILGPRGLMPNPKTGTVTSDVGRAVRETKAGKIEFRVDKTGVIHAPVGKVSFDKERLVGEREDFDRCGYARKAVNRQRQIRQERYDLFDDGTGHQAEHRRVLDLD